MRLQDIIHETEEEELAAISQFFKGRADDEGIAGTLSTDAFANIANKLGLSVDAEKLQQMVQQGQIDNIADVNNDEVKFDSDEKIGPEMMGRDKAEVVVQQAAKRAAAKRKK